MLRKILVLIAGFVSFVVVVTVVQLINGLIFGMPKTETLNSPEAMQAYVTSMPVGAFIGLLVSYIVGSFSSGYLMRVISKWDSMLLPLVIGLIGTCGWAYTITQISHPIWVTIAGFLCYLPFTFLGYRAAK